MTILKPYPKYKPSGVEWLGDVPQEWKILPAKRFFYSRKEINKNMKEKQRLALTLRGVVDRSLNDVEGLQASDYSTYQIFEKDDLVFKLIDLQNIQTSRVGIVPKRGIMSPAYIRLSATSSLVYPRYYYWLFYALYLNNVFNDMGSGVRESLNASELLEFNTPIFDRLEQTRIASLIDSECSKIDALIEKSERMLALLDEKRQAVITHYVTKGTNPKAKLKPSGIEWIGNIPEGWEMKKLKFLGQSIMGLTYSPEDVVESENGTLVLRSSNLQNGKISLDDNVYVNREIPKKLITRKGDILICSRNGSRDLIGKNALIENDGLGCSFGAFTTVFRSPYNNFIYYVFQSQLFDYQAGIYLTSTINQLTIGVLNNFEIPFAPESEHEKIVELIEQKTSKIDALKSKIIKQVELLKERKTSLITAVVTGKIDVRDYKKQQEAA